MLTSGIYAIINLVDGKHYVGSALNLEKRWARHQHDLKWNKHHNSKLQRAWIKHGPESFRFDILERVNPVDIIVREQYWLDETLPFYNILRVAKSALGYKHTDEARLKNSLKSKLWHSSLSDEERAKRYKSHAIKITGKKVSEATRLKMSVSHKGKQPHENSIKNLFEARTKDPDYYFKAADARAKTLYVVTNPEGVEMEVRNMSKFCRENALNQAHMTAVAKGKRLRHKGWLCKYKDPIPAIDATH